MNKAIFAYVFFGLFVTMCTNENSPEMEAARMEMQATRLAKPIIDSLKMELSKQCDAKMDSLVIYLSDSIVNETLFNEEESVEYN